MTSVNEGNPMWLQKACAITGAIKWPGKEKHINVGEMLQKACAIKWLGKEKHINVGEMLQRACAITWAIKWLGKEKHINVGEMLQKACAMHYHMGYQMTWKRKTY